MGRMVPPQVWLARSREWMALANTENDSEMARIFHYLAAEAVAAAVAEMTIMPDAATERQRDGD